MQESLQHGMADPLNEQNLSILCRITYYSAHLRRKVYDGTTSIEEIWATGGGVDLGEGTNPNVAVHVKLKLCSGLFEVGKNSNFRATAQINSW